MSGPFIRTVLAFALVAVGVALNLGLVAEVAGMRALAAGPSPFMVAEHGLVLYLAMPLLAVASALFLLSPGLILSTAFLSDKTAFADWLLRGTAISVIGVPLIASLVQLAMGGRILVAMPFVGLVVALSLVSLVILQRRDSEGWVHWSVLGGRRLEWAVILLVPFLALILLSAKFYWEDFNGDGAHTMQAARTFIHRGIPFWPAGVGSVGNYPGLTTLLEVFPNSSMVRLFGEHELSLRLTYLFGLIPLVGVLAGLIRWNRRGNLSAAEALGLGAAVLLFSFVLAFNTSYNPYFADVTLPMAREPWVLIGFLGFLWFFLRDRLVWMLVFALMAHVAAPNGLIMMAFWFAAFFLVARPLPWAVTFGRGIMVLGAVVALTVSYTLLQRSGLVYTSDEFGLKAIALRLRFVSLFDVERLLYWVLPAGILPALALLLWPAQDRLSRMLTLVTLAYVGFFYVQAYRILPHHFVPAMVIPLIVYWRLGPVTRAPFVGGALALVAIGVSAALSWPQTLHIHQETSSFARRIAVEDSSYAAYTPAELDGVEAVLSAAFPYGYTEEDAATALTGAPITWYTYAVQPKAEGQQVDYTVRKTSSTPAPGEVMIGEPQDGFALYTTDLAIYEVDKARGGLTRSIADVYYVTRSKLFGRGASDGPRVVWDVAKLAGVR